MKRTFQWVTMFTVAASMTAMAQQTSPTTAGTSTMQAAQGEKVTVQGCLQPGTGMGSSSSSTNSQGATPTPAPTGSTGTAGSTAPTGTSPTAAAPAGSYGSATGSGMYMLRVTDGGSGNANTGMPSATGGQADARSAAGQQGGRVYHLMADSANDLSKHVGHQIEVTGTLASAGAGRHSGMSGTGATGTTGSGTTGSGAAAPTDSTTGSTGSTTGGTAAGAGSMAAMAGKAAAASVLQVSSIKMIAATCR